MSLLFNMLSRFVIAFLPRRKHLLNLWVQWPSIVILEPKKVKSVTASTFSPSICHEVIELGAMIFVCWMLSFKPAFLLSSFTLTKGLFSSFWISATQWLEWNHLHIWGCSYSSQQSWFQLVIHTAWHLAWCTGQMLPHFWSQREIWGALKMVQWWTEAKI